jgi:hypothetical protein
MIRGLNLAFPPVPVENPRKISFTEAKWQWVLQQEL